eukprot:g19284.t1
MSNAQLYAEMKKEIKSAGGVQERGDGEDEEAAEEEEDEGGGEDGEAPLGAVEEEKTIPPAAYMKIVLQVLTQTEASSENDCACKIKEAVWITRQKLCKWKFLFMSKTVDEVCAPLSDCNILDGATCSADSSGRFSGLSL